VQARVPQAAYAQLLETACVHHGARLREVMDAAPAELERERIERLLPRYSAPEHRLALGLLWSGADLASMERVLRARGATRPAVELLGEWLDEMSVGPASTAGLLRDERETLALFARLRRSMRSPAPAGQPAQ
jgi:hypothetical protein